MIRKIILFTLISAIVGTASVSCSEDIPDCPSKMCVLAGTWKLTEVYIDGSKETADLSKYSLTLVMPAPTDAPTADYQRTQPSGASDDGTWSIENNGDILRLVPGNDPVLTEDWIIEYFTLRQLRIVINRDTGIKDGPSKIEFVLEPA